MSETKFFVLLRVDKRANGSVALPKSLNENEK